MKKNLLLILSVLAFAQSSAIAQFFLSSQMEFDFNNAEDLSGQWMNKDCKTDGASCSLKPHDGAFYFSWPKTSSDQPWYWATDLKLPNINDWVANYGADAGIQFDINTCTGDTVQIQCEIDNQADTKFGGFALTVPADTNKWKTVTFYFKDLQLSNWTPGSTDVLNLADQPSVVKFSLSTGDYPNDIPMNVMIDNVKLVNKTTGASELEYDFNNAEDLSDRWSNADIVTEGATWSLKPRDGAFYYSWPKTSADPAWYWATDLRLPYLSDWADYAGEAGIQFDINTTNGDTVQIQTQIDNQAGTKFGGYATTVYSPNKWTTVTFYFKNLTLNNWSNNSDVLNLADVPGVVKFSLCTGSYPNDLPLNVMIDNVKLVNGSTGASKLEYDFNNAEDFSCHCDLDDAIEYPELMPRDGAFYFNWPKSTASKTWYWATELSLPDLSNWVTNYGADAGIQFDINTTNGDSVQIQTEIDNVAGTKFGGFALTVNADTNTWQTVQFRFADLSLSNWSCNTDILDISNAPSAVKLSLNTGSYPNNVPMNVMIDNVKLVNIPSCGKSTKCDDFKKLNIPGYRKNGCGVDIEKLNISGNNNITIFPNPANAVIYVNNIQSNAASATIFNMQGKPVIDNIRVSDGQAVDISKLNNGFYFIKIIDSGNVSVSKFIKK